MLLVVLQDDKYIRFAGLETKETDGAVETKVAVYLLKVRMSVSCECVYCKLITDGVAVFKQVGNANHSG